MLLVGLHPPFEAVVLTGRFGCDPQRVVVQELNALHIVLEAAVCELGNVHMVRQAKLLYVGCEKAKVALTVVLVACVEAQPM